MVFNWIQWFEVLYLQKGFKVHWIVEMMELSNKAVEWAKFTQFFSKKKAWLAPWMEERGSKLFFPNWKLKYGLQAQQLCNMYHIGIIMVVMVWCTRCELKGLIAS